MDIDTKRSASNVDLERIQSSNRQWWTDQTMSYDWKDKVEGQRFSKQWFDEIDRRFIFGARLFAHDQQPFDRIIPFDAIRDRDVLEIGCGMGLHSELMLKAGARLTSIDISDTSVEATQNRLKLRGLPANVRQMDARFMDFPAESFDLVWSWGVIHHSAQTARVMRDIARVLRPGGEARIMVYNLDGLSAYYTIVRDHLFGFWRGRSLDDALWKRSDGFMARYYTRDMLGDVLGAFFTEVKVQPFGQDADGVPLPRQLRRPIMKLMSHDRLARRANTRGSMLFAIARK